MLTQSRPSPQGKPASTALLAWYDRHRRALPWRVLAHETADPYRIWLSEIMLQQTTVQAVKPYFEAFTLRWPRVDLLAAAPIEAIMQSWAGLGYYSRARNLHACAQAVVERFSGQFPADETALRELPGIGAYTAAAISAIAFGRRAVVVDGNVERVIARLFSVEEALPRAKPAIRHLADSLTPQERPGDYAQAMMDLGATICTPRKPACNLCPLLQDCSAHRGGAPETYPRKTPKSAKITRYGQVFVVVRRDGAILVRIRPPKGLLGGMTEVPGTEWLTTINTADPAESAPLLASWHQHDESVRHVFTHFPLELSVFTAHVPMHTPAPSGMVWLAENVIAAAAFPTLFRKVLAVGNLQLQGETRSKLG